MYINADHIVSHHTSGQSIVKFSSIFDYFKIFLVRIVRILSSFNVLDFKFLRFGLKTTL